MFQQQLVASEQQMLRHPTPINSPTGRWPPSRRHRHGNTRTRRRWDAGVSLGSPLLGGRRPGPEQLRHVGQERGGSHTVLVRDGPGPDGLTVEAGGAFLSLPAKVLGETGAFSGTTGNWSL